MQGSMAADHPWQDEHILCIETLSLRVPFAKILCAPNIGNAPLVQQKGTIALQPRTIPISFQKRSSDNEHAAPWRCFHRRSIIP
jgi:hypothetical protein